MTPSVSAVVALAVLVLLALALSLKIITQYERGIVFRLGRLRPVYEPGLHLVVPFLERLVRVDTRVVTLTIPPQEVITEDNVPARVNAVVLFNVTDPVKAVMEVENYAIATSQIAQTTLRSVLGRVDLDTVLAHRSALNADLRDIIEKLTEPWGVEVSVVEIKDVEIPEQMQRAMARGAEAERERREAILQAEGEKQSAILVAEGEKQSAVLRAEASKQAQILAAEAEKEAAILRAQGEAQAILAVQKATAEGIEMVKAAGADQAVLTLKSLEALAQVADGQATKIIIPSEIQGLAGLATTAGELFQPTK